MEFQYSEESLQRQSTVREFMERHVLPQHVQFERMAARRTYPTAVVEPLKALAREAGLWNLFLPGLRDDEPGTRLTNMDYAPLAEIIGRVP